MNKDKQIERLKKEISDVWIVDWEGNAHNLSEKLWDDELENIAIELYNIGYRKQSKPFSCGHEKGGEWISVDERLPEKDGRYLVAMKNGDNYHISTRKFKRADPPHWWKGVIYGRWARYTGGVRYWMPLPEPPNMKGGDNDA